jgi:hypothetical protein
LPDAGRSLAAASGRRARHRSRELRRLGDGVDQAPVHRLLAAHARGGAEDVGQVVAHMALVGHARQAAGAGQHAQQRHLGQADGELRSSTSTISSQASASS